MFQLLKSFRPQYTKICLDENYHAYVGNQGKKVNKHGNNKKHCWFKNVL